jgi:hypothetical protein
MARIVQANRRATNRQITVKYNIGVQKGILERTSRRALSQMGYCSRQQHRVPLLSANNKKMMIQWAHNHQHWTIEEWKNIAWSDKSRFLLHHADGRVRIWHKQHESMNPSGLVSTVQAGGGGVLPSNLQQLRDAVALAWTNIPVKCFWLVESTPQWIQAVMGGSNPVLDESN